MKTDTLRTDTPRTQAIRDDLMGIPSEGKIWNLFKRLEDMERELNAARAEIERLDTAGIHSCHNDCQRPNCVLRRELKAVTEQRDRLAEALWNMLNQEHGSAIKAGILLRSLNLQQLNPNTPDQERKSPTSDGSEIK